MSIQMGKYEFSLDYKRGIYLAALDFWESANFVCILVTSGSFNYNSYST